jgi:flagella basal body P-ring formation protein FlgA
MIKRSALAALAVLLTSSVAIAAPVLKSHIVVTGAVVTIGDMFEDAGLAAEDAIFRAPKPGTSGMVRVTDIQAAVGRLGLSFDPQGLDAVRVSRASSLVDESTLEALITADLAGRGILATGMSANVHFANPIPAINAEAVSQPASIVGLRYMPGTGSFSARIAIAGLEQSIEVAGSIELLIEAPHLTRSFPAGTILSQSDVVMRPVPLRFAESTGVAQLNDVVGKALTRQSREGMMLKPNDVAVPALIAKNDLVTIYFRQGAMTLTVKGQAITSATRGAPVQVLNLMSKRVISATAIAAGAVEVSASPMTLAGL